MFELTFGLLVIAAIIGFLVFLGWVAVFFDAAFLLPSIGSLLFWLIAALNFRDAIDTRDSRLERVTALIRAICFVAMTVPLYFPEDFPFTLYYSLGALATGLLATFLLNGLPALMQKNSSPTRSHTDDQATQHREGVDRSDG